MKVYLGGYMAVDNRLDWRRAFKHEARHLDVEWLEPHANIEHYAMRDLALLRQADVMVAYVTPWVNKGVGVSWEMGWCYATSVPVIMVMTEGHDYASWGLNEQFASCVTRSLEDAVLVLDAMCE